MTISSAARLAGTGAASLSSIVVTRAPRSTLLLASAASILIAAPALAQDRGQDHLRDDDIVVTGTKTGDFGGKSGIPIDKVPQSIQVINDEDIVASGSRTIEDALRAVPSATVARSRIGGYAGNTLRIRGFTPQQIRNGIYQRFYDGTDPSALSNVARIEVLKGPSGVLYGQSGVGGIISIITKQPTDAFEGSLALTGGIYGQKIATVDIGGPITDTLGIRLTGEIERSGSFTDYIDVHRENVGVALTWKPTSWISAHFVGEYLHRELPTDRVCGRLRLACRRRRQCFAADFRRGCAAHAVRITRHARPFDIVEQLR